MVKPSALEDIFPAAVYAGLGDVISAYGDEEKSGPLARRPIDGSRIAGYYTELPDGRPVLSGTSIKGLYIQGSNTHLGVMIGTGEAEYMANIIIDGEPSLNPFRLNREFKSEGIKL